MIKTKNSLYSTELFFYSASACRVLLSSVLPCVSLEGRNCPTHLCSDPFVANIVELNLKNVCKYVGKCSLATSGHLVGAALRRLVKE
jgi:hypothetical protein